MWAGLPAPLHLAFGGGGLSQARFLLPSPAVSTEAGCTNLAAALALLLGEQASLQRFAGQHPEVWADLYGLLANDVHLCGYAPVLSPLPSPVVGAGGLTAGALLAA